MEVTSSVPTGLRGRTVLHRQVELPPGTGFQEAVLSTGGSWTPSEAGADTAAEGRLLGRAPIRDVSSGRVGGKLTIGFLELLCSRLLVQRCEVVVDWPGAPGLGEDALDVVGGAVSDRVPELRQPVERHGLGPERGGDQRTGLLFPQQR